MDGKNHLLLNNWMYKVIQDNPEIIKETKSAIEIYSNLNSLFIIDIQKCMKAMAKEILKVEKN